MLCCAIDNPSARSDQLLMKSVITINKPLFKVQCITAGQLHLMPHAAGLASTENRSSIANLLRQSLPTSLSQSVCITW